MMNLETLAGQPSPWLDATGPHSDLVLSTRVRLARNLVGVPFTHRARDEQLVSVLGAVQRAADGAEAFSGGGLLKMHELSPNDRQFLVERRCLWRHAEQVVEGAQAGFVHPRRHDGAAVAVSGDVQHD